MTKRICTLLFLLVLVTAVNSIELISETYLGDMYPKFIRVEHNTAFLFQVDSLEDSITTYIVNCSDPYYPEVTLIKKLPSTIMDSYYEFHPLDANDSLLFVLNDSNTIDIYKHLDDTLFLFESYTDTLVRFFENYVQLYDTFMVVNRWMYYEYNYILAIYSINNLHDIYLVDSVYCPLSVSFEAEDGWLCHSSGLGAQVYSMHPENFMEDLGGFSCGGDYNFRNLEICGDYIFIEGRACAVVEAGTLNIYHYWEPGPHEYFIAHFEIWNNYIIKGARTASHLRWPMRIAYLYSLPPYPDWTWIDSIRGDIFDIEDTLLYTFGQDTLRIYNLNSLYRGDSLSILELVPYNGSVSSDPWQPTMIRFGGEYPFIDTSSVFVWLDSTRYDLSYPGLTMDARGLYFIPEYEYADGGSVHIRLEPVIDFWDRELLSHDVEWYFRTDFSPPFIVDITPEPGDTISAWNFEFEVLMEDGVDGIEPSSILLRIDSVNIDLSNPGLNWIEPETLRFNSSLACITFESGDTIQINILRVCDMVDYGEANCIPDTEWVYHYFPTGIQEKQLIPDNLVITCYPNPFNSSVCITIFPPFNIPGYPEIKIFSLNGKELAVLGCPGSPNQSKGLVLGVISKNSTGSRITGSPSFIWSPDESITSGIYLVRVQMGSEIQTQKVIYLK